MSEYIDIPRLPSTQNFQHVPSSYGKPDGFAAGTSIPRVTRVSYGTAGAGTAAQRPSWGTNAWPVSRPASTPLHAPVDQHPPTPGPEAIDSRTRKTSRSQSSRAYGQPSPGAGDALSLPSSPPPRPWTSAPNTDVGMPTASWVSSSYAAHPESILSPDSPYPLHPPPSRMAERSVEQPRSPLFQIETQHEAHSYFGEQQQSSPVLDQRSLFSMEHMDIDPEERPSVIEDPGPRVPGRMIGNVYTPPEPVKKPSIGRRFIGGFVAGLRKFPRAMTKNTPSEDIPATMPQPFTNVPHSSPQYGHPYEVYRPANPQQERIDLRQSRATATTSSTQSSGVNRGPATPPNLPNPYAPPTELQTPASIASPIEVHPQPTSDYDAMSEPTADPEEASLNTRANRVGKFVKDLGQLPWISSHVAEEYNPAQSHRAQQDKPSGSWYTKRGHQQLDLLEGPAPAKTQVRQRSRAVPPEVKQARSHHRPRPERVRTGTDAATAIRPTRTPASATSGGVIPTSPGASSHGRGSHTYSYSYYYSTPQPLYVYPSAVSPQLRRGEGAGTALPEGQQAVPVYMLATPAPLMLPTSPSHRSPSRPHRSAHHHKTSSPHTSPRKA